MEPLPMAPSCSLDEDGLRAQGERYRRVGEAAELVERGRRRLVIKVAEDVDAGLVAALIAVERECCSFFSLHWDEVSRRLSISVSRPRDEPALAAIELALAIEAGR